jgi:hypothetical protein
MLTLFIGPLILFTVALFGAAAIIGFQSGRIASGHVVLDSYPDLGVVINRKIDHAHRAFAHFFKHLGHNLSILCLLVLRRITRISKLLTIIAERKFSRLIETIRGKGVVGKRGSASLFLTSLVTPDATSTETRTSR